MRKVILLNALLCLFIYVRGATAEVIPLWGYLWWLWIVVTIAMAQCAGWVAHIVYLKNRKSNGN